MLWTHYTGSACFSQVENAVLTGVCENMNRCCAPAVWEKRGVFKGVFRAMLGMVLGATFGEEGYVAAAVGGCRSCGKQVGLDWAVLGWVGLNRVGRLMPVQ